MSAFQVLAESHRRHILDLLREGERSVNELVAGLGLSQPGVSKHLRVLRDAGLVGVRVDAQRRLYALRPQPLAEVDRWLEPYRALWGERLDALDRHLDQSAKEPHGGATPTRTATSPPWTGPSPASTRHGCRRSPPTGARPPPPARHPRPPHLGARTRRRPHPPALHQQARRPDPGRPHRRRLAPAPRRPGHHP